MRGAAAQGNGEGGTPPSVFLCPVGRVGAYCYFIVVNSCTYIYTYT